MTKKIYKVLSAVEFDKRYEADSLITLDDEHAEGLLKVNAIELTDAVPVNVDQARQDTIVAAINQIDKDDTDLWQKDGKPKVDAVSAIMGSLVSATERNNAWAIINAVV